MKKYSDYVHSEEFKKSTELPSLTNHIDNNVLIIKK